MESKFTKGEWKVEVVDDDTCMPQQVDVGVTIPGFITFWATLFKENKGEAIANAHLISAAPDMYEALKLALKELDFDNNEGVYEHIVEALSKAEGK